MVGERPDVGALRLRRAHRRPNDPERGQTTRESGREPDESSKSGCSTDTAIAAIGSKSRILNSLLAINKRCIGATAIAAMFALSPMTPALAYKIGSPSNTEQASKHRFRQSVALESVAAADSTLKCNA